MVIFSIVFLHRTTGSGHEVDAGATNLGATLRAWIARWAGTDMHSFVIELDE
jgi:hypothetical protein